MTRGVIIKFTRTSSRRGRDDCGTSGKYNISLEYRTHPRTLGIYDCKSLNIVVCDTENV